MEVILLIQELTCAFLTGLIWVIQILHYPAFADISTDRFGQFHAAHSRNISFIVGPAMVVELVTALWLAALAPNPALIANAVGVVGIWLSTFFLSIPLHDKLADRSDALVIQRLVKTNWPRTVLWSARLLLLAIVLYLQLRG